MVTLSPAPNRTCGGMFKVPVSSSSSSSFLDCIFLFLPRRPFLGVGVPFSSSTSPMQFSAWRSMVFCWAHSYSPWSSVLDRTAIVAKPSWNVLCGWRSYCTCCIQKQWGQSWGRGSAWSAYPEAASVWKFSHTGCRQMASPRCVCVCALSCGAPGNHQIK